MNMLLSSQLCMTVYFYPRFCYAAHVKALMDKISKQQEVLKFKREVLGKSGAGDGDEDEDTVSGETGEARALAAVEDEALSPARPKKLKRASSGAKNAKKAKKSKKDSSKKGKKKDSKKDKNKDKKKKKEESEAEWDSDEDDDSSGEESFESSSSSDEDHAGNDVMPGKKSSKRG